MTINSRHIFFVTLMVWLMVGIYILDHNLAPRGHVELQWPQPAQPTAHFAWAGYSPGATSTSLQPHESRRFAVTLPRGFSTGGLTITTASANDQLRLNAESRPGKKVAAVTGQQTVTMPIRWGDLIADGRTFFFTVETTGDQVTTVKKIQLTLKR